jgi:catechol 2,3-dioxygenase
VIAPGTHIGAVHVTIADLARSIRFYESHVGFVVQRRDGLTAWLGAEGPAAGGYHHIGLNTWAGVGAPPPPPGALGLHSFQVKLASAAALAQVESRVHAAGIPSESVDGGRLIPEPARNAIRLTAR